MAKAIIVEHNGIMKTYKQLVEEYKDYGITVILLSRRLIRGQDLETALTTKVRPASSRKGTAKTAKGVEKLTYTPITSLCVPIKNIMDYPRNDLSIGRVHMR